MLSVFLCILFEDIYQKICVKYVVAHGDQCLFWVLRHGNRVFRLFLKPLDPAFLVSLNDPELAGLLQWDRKGGNSDISLILDMEIYHLPDIPPVNMVCTEDKGDIRG